MKSTSSDGSYSVITCDTNWGTSSAMVVPIALTNCENAKRAWNRCKKMILVDYCSYRVPHDALRLHRIEGLEKRFGHLLERRLVRDRLKLVIRDLGEAFRKVTEGQEVVVHLKHGLKVIRRFQADAENERTGDHLEKSQLT